MSNKIITQLTDSQNCRNKKNLDKR